MQILTDNRWPTAAECLDYDFGPSDLPYMINTCEQVLVPKELGRLVMDFAQEWALIPPGAAGQCRVYMLLFIVARDPARWSIALHHMPMDA